MSHRERIEELVETEQPGLAEWVAGEDARLDADREAQLRLVDRGRWEKIIAAQTDAAIVGEDPFMRDGVIGPLVDVLSDHAAGDTDPKAARRTRARKVRDPNTKWGDEIEALRALAASEVQVRSGDLDRMTQRLALGASIQTSTRNREPPSDPWLHAVGAAVSRLTRAERELLWWVHVEFEAPTQRTTDDLIAEAGPIPVPVRVLDDLLGPSNDSARAKETDVQIRKRLDAFGAWWRNGRKVKDGEHTALLPAGVPIEPPRRSMNAMELAKSGILPRDSVLQAEGLRWEHLVAERLGLNVSGALGPLDPRKADDPEPAEGEVDERRITWLEDSARQVRASHQAARRRLRELLLAVTLDVRPQFLVPAPTMRELDRDAADDGTVTVECCSGVHIENGVRLPCEPVAVEGSVRRHPSKAWPRCSVCERPTVEVRS